MDTTDQDTPRAVSDPLENALSRQSSRSIKPSLNSVRPESKPPPLLKIELLEDLWKVMAETYGHRWTSNFGVLPRVDHAWAKHLTGLCWSQIANGLAQMSNLDSDGWPPSAPQFRKFCLQAPGLPSSDDAWTEAIVGAYSHDAVRVAAEATSTFDLRSAKPGDKLLRQRFERNYAIVMRRAQTGQSLCGRIAEGITHDSMRPREQIQLEHSCQEVEARVLAQGIPTNAQAARYQLLAMLGIRRDNHA